MKKTAKKVARRPVAKKSASRKAAARPLVRSASKKKPISGVVKLLEVVRATPTRKRQKAA